MASSLAVLNEFDGARLLKDVPSILLMGARQGGKSSIHQVVFQKLQPHQTHYIHPTVGISSHKIFHNDLVKFQMLDFPGSFDFNESEFKPQHFFKHCSVLVFVIDAQDSPYQESLNYILKMIEISDKINKNIKYEILINKIDAEAFFTADAKLAIRRAIEERISEQLDNLGINRHENISYYNTSIYDHSIFEAMSEIVQQLLPPPVSHFLKNLLTSFVTKCDIEKAFIFDVVSKLYIATDANLMESDTTCLCSDLLDVTVDVSVIQGKLNHIPVEDDSHNPSLQDANQAFDYVSSFIATLNPQSGRPAKTPSIVVLRQVGTHLALVCIMKKPKNKGLVEYNIDCFQKAMTQLFGLLRKMNGKELKTGWSLLKI